MPFLAPEQVPDAVVHDLETSLGDDLISVVLYGSRARGEAADDSDWDFLVIAEGIPESHMSRCAYIRESLPTSSGNRVSVLAKTPAEMDGPPVALYLDIAFDGEVLRDTEGFVRAHLASLRAYARRERLRRDRTKHGDMWWYPVPKRERDVAAGSQRISRLDAASFRLTLARGYLDEARQDVTLSRWRSCVDGSQLAAESAAKAAVALVAVVGRSHEPGEVIDRALRDGRYPAALEGDLARLSELAKTLGPEVHIQSDYGDEETFTTPWELFHESHAQAALATAEAAVALAEEIVTAFGSASAEDFPTR